ncbi:MAG: hypothetical protein ACE5E9_10250 [Nitrospinaceae bacterium]
MEPENEVESGIREKENRFRRNSFWTAIILASSVVIWYYIHTPPDTEEVQRMRIFFKENIMDVTHFLRLPRQEKIAFANSRKHPFYKKYIKASEVEKARIKSLVHISYNYTPYQYWFNLAFLWTIFFAAFWFIGLMTEGAVILVRNEKAKRKGSDRHK